MHIVEMFRFVLSMSKHSNSFSSSVLEVLIRKIGGTI
jgi:hypothetical protein